MASAVDTAIIGRPEKRTRSTWTSAATITAAAAPTSSAVRTSAAPWAPCVSTDISCPIAAAWRLSASAAMKVCATPVGHAVTAINLMIPPGFLFDFRLVQQLAWV
jgi:hypothetical protein